MSQMDVVDFYRHDFQLEDGNGQLVAQIGFSVEPAHFVDKYLKPYGAALLALLSNTDTSLVPAQTSQATNQHLADVRYCGQVIFNLLCFPNQLWRTAALLAIMKAQTTKMKVTKAQNPASWLRAFVRELECLTLGAILLPCTVTQQKAAFSRLVQKLSHVSHVQCELQMHCSLHSVTSS